MDNVKCIGCGVTLQSSHEDKLGYIPKSGLMKPDAICKRCFRLKNYNEIMDVDVDSSEYMTMLNALYETDGLIVKVIDVFDFDSSIIPSFHRIVGDKRVIVAINKLDLLPRSINTSRLIHQIKYLLREHGIKAVETVAISALRKQGIERLMDTINDYRDDLNVYVVGTTNVGKSTLINALIESTTGDKNVITTSRFPGTTLDLIDIPLGDGSFIFDTPGVVVSSQLTTQINREDLKYVMPTKEIKPKTYQLNAEQTLFLSSLASMSYIAGERNSFTVYISDKLPVHRTKYDNLTAFYEQHYDTMLTPPTLDAPVVTQTKPLLLDVEPNSDILISGLCFITVQQHARIEIRVDSNVNVYVRPSIFKGSV